ncbi:MAG TPA: leucyl/phenylalanyl-tRNA--protein transferase [Gammaproteobacteria bacterium]|nr:leucyl/phenylalanyl-tRNA--protein transferase [Gammaproteobacteria bacterium]
MTGISLCWIHASEPPDAFPPVERALADPNGLLAAGGDLSIPRLLGAYRRGIFPWYEAGQPILWWSPDPRMVLYPGELHVSRSLRKTLRRNTFEVAIDRAFADVLDGCAAPRDAYGTWLTAEMKQAYLRLHQAGFAHSFEAWRYGRLVGGLYGIELGRVFFGESMFSRESDASKVALACLCQRDYDLIDCQVESPHLRRMGARLMPRRQFLECLDAGCADAYNEIVT